MSKSALDDSPKQALNRVHDVYNNWGERLDAFSVQFCYALIAANWAVFDSTGAILSNVYAKWSMLLALITLVLKLAGLSLVTALLALRVDYGESDPGRWKIEYEAHQGKETVWPFSVWIMRWADWLRWMKVMLPLASGGLLITAVISNGAEEYPERTTRLISGPELNGSTRIVPFTLLPYSAADLRSSLCDQGMCTIHRTRCKRDAGRLDCIVPSTESPQAEVALPTSTLSSELGPRIPNNQLWNIRNASRAA